MTSRLNHHSPELGATYLGRDRCEFLVWAPRAQNLAVHLVAPQDRLVPLARHERGYFHAGLDGAAPGTRYYYRLDDRHDRPDPASRYQPEGVHGPSEVVDANTFNWSDAGWSGLAMRALVLYELHVGTFTTEGTFDAAIPHLDALRDLGITAIELMPVAQFPGSRNWGYDGTYPYAAQYSYGGPDGLRRLVDACHARGLALILDVVYNHLGPEGNYLGEYGPYFTDRYHTPWGAALNFDGPDSDEVRRYFVESALYWLTDCHVDGFRLDAIHAILDMAARPFLQEIASAVHERAERLRRRVLVIAESDLNDVRVIRPPELGGFGMDAQWSDDLHHALHALLTGERGGYYADFGTLDHLARAYTHGYVYTGQYSTHRRRRHGNSPRPRPADQFVVCAQNHDQVGNRAQGDRLSTLVSFDELKLAACVVLLAPFVPLLFMGEEYGEQAPFQYFTSHSDPRLIEGVRNGRAAEFAAFAWQGAVPDPQDEATYERSRLRRKLRELEPHRWLYELYRELLRLRRQIPLLTNPDLEQIDVRTYEREEVLCVRRGSDAQDQEVCALFAFGGTEVTLRVPHAAGCWRSRLDTAAPRWGGYGPEGPSLLESQGELEVTLGPTACRLLERVASGA
jgi:maltooligosyltrehalose trehalohydrolase